MKSYKITIEEIFSAIDSEVFAINKRKGDWFMMSIKREAERLDITNIEFSLSQKRRILRLINFYSFAFKSKNFDHLLVLSSVKAYADKTRGREERYCKKAYESMLKIPKCCKKAQRVIKGLNCESKERDLETWGKEPLPLALGLDKVEYYNMVKRAQKTLKEKE